jgi:nucleotide-binding universal stress UspA family protein
MKKILVAIDFSDCSINALEHAITIANRASAGILMIFVVKPATSRDMIMDPPKTLSAMVREKFEGLVKKYQPMMGDNALDFTIREGKVFTEIIREAADKSIFLVVAGTHGASGFEEFWMGSNAFRIVTTSPKPVITIREDVPVKRDLKKIVMPIDSSDETRQKVPFTAFIAQIFQAEVYILSVYTSKIQAVKRRVDSYTEQVEKHFTEENIKYVLESVYADNVTESTIEYARKIDANLISIMTEQERKARNLWLGTYAQQMVNHARFPVLTIRPKELLVSLSR